jgi:hypothetical protein
VVKLFFLHFLLPFHIFFLFTSIIYFMLPVLLVSPVQCKEYVNTSSGTWPIVSARAAEIRKKQEADT